MTQYFVRKQKERRGEHDIHPTYKHDPYFYFLSKFDKNALNINY